MVRKGVVSGPKSDMPHATDVNPKQLRPLVRGEFVENPDGSRSTERTMSFNIEGKEVLAPSLWMSPDGPVDLRQHPEILIRAIREFEMRTKKRFPRFDTPEEATEFAKGRSSGGAVFSGPLER